MALEIIGFSTVPIVVSSDPAAPLRLFYQGVALAKHGHQVIAEHPLPTLVVGGFASPLYFEFIPGSAGMTVTAEYLDANGAPISLVELNRHGFASPTTDFLGVRVTAKTATTSQAINVYLQAKPKGALPDCD